MAAQFSGELCLERVVTGRGVALRMEVLLLNHAAYTRLAYDSPLQFSLELSPLQFSLFRIRSLLGLGTLHVQTLV